MWLSPNVMKIGKRKYILIAVAILIFIAGYAAVYFVMKDSTEAQEEDASYACSVSLRFISVGLLRYSQQNGNFPEDMATLVRLGYVESPNIFRCSQDSPSPYHYCAGIKNGMPENLPMIIEPNAPHIYRPPNENPLRYGRILYADFSIQACLQEHVEEALIQTKRAFYIIHDARRDQILEVLHRPRSDTFLEQAAALWRLRQNPPIVAFDTLNEGALLTKYIQTLSRVLSKDPYYREERTPYYLDPRPAARQAAYLWVEMHRPQAVEKLNQIFSSHQSQEKLWRIFVEELANPNYFAKKNAWRVLFTDLDIPPVEMLYPKTSQASLSLLLKNLSEK